MKDPYFLEDYITGVFRPPEKELFPSMYNTLLAAGYDKEDVVHMKDEYIFAVGNIPVMLVAHLDTVHRSAVKKMFYDPEMRALWSPEGIGGDDRAGVLAIVQLLSEGFHPYVLLTTGEETGAHGARSAAKDLHNLLHRTDGALAQEGNGLKYIIEVDRRNYDDAVFYGCDNPEWTKYVESFGFKKSWGSFTDISVLCPDWGIAGVNLSSGYYEAHSTTEYVLLEELQDTCEKIKRMLQDESLLDGSMPVWEYIPVVYQTVKYDGKGASKYPYASSTGSKKASVKSYDYDYADDYIDAYWETFMSDSEAAEARAEIVKQQKDNTIRNPIFFRSNSGLEMLPQTFMARGRLRTLTATRGHIRLGILSGELIDLYADPDAFVTSKYNVAGAKEAEDSSAKALPAHEPATDTQANSQEPASSEQASRVASSY